MVLPSLEDPLDIIDEDMLHGEFNFGGLKMYFDLRPLLEERKREVEMQKRANFMVKEDGEIMMFTLGIY